MSENHQAPLLSIHCLVYNHARYLRDCLNGFVMQKTDFAFEAIVHDDASTDESAAIIREYAEKYPHIIKPIYQTENQYCKKDGSIGRAVAAAYSPESRYVAFCEGDDYWTDSTKLQKQVDFLETHPDYSMCFHRAMMKWEHSDKPDEIFSQLEDREYSGVEIFHTWLVPTASVVVRRSVFTSDIYKRVHASRQLFHHGDILIFLCAAAVGKLRAMSDIMSVYRRHEGGVVYSLTDEAIQHFFRHEYYVTQFFGKQYSRSASDVIATMCCSRVMSYCSQACYGKAWKIFLSGLRYAPFRTAWYVTRRGWDSVQRNVLRVRK